jgi:hypothetical protein
MDFPPEGSHDKENWLGQQGSPAQYLGLYGAAVAGKDKTVKSERTD